MSPHAKGSLWYYAPNEAAPIAFTVIFGLSAVFHIYTCIRYKSWKLSGTLPWGSLVLAAGFAMRAVGATDYKNLDTYIASTVLLVMGPPVYAAHLYIVLGRAMYYVPWLAPMHPGRVITTFLGLDLICGILLGSGVARAANTSLSDTEQTVGTDLLRAGLILQVVMFGCYIALAIHFHILCTKKRVASKIRSVMIVLYITSILILERSTYRVVEFCEGYNGTVYRTEPLFWVFEASAMALTTIILNVWAPARLLPTSNKIYLAMDGVTEREGPGWVDKRPFLLTLVDPFDLGSMCSKRQTNVKFWENDEGPIVSQQAGEKDVEAPNGTPVNLY